MKCAPPVAALAVLLAATMTAQVPESIRLGTWNLEFFGNRRNEPRTDEDIAKVATFLRGIGVDVLAVQEVGTLAALQKLARALGPSWHVVLGTTGMWRDGSGGQRVGFVWNDARLQLLQAEELLDLPREVDDPQTTRLPIFHRVPVSAVFRARNGGLDFRAVTVHLKADNRRDLDQHQRDEMSTRKRIAEMTALGAALTKIMQRDGEDQDVVVLGDFNHVFARERSTEQADEIKVRFDLGVPLLANLPSFARLAPARPQPTIRWFPESIDHVVVSADLREEAIAQSVTVHGPFAEHEPSPAELDAWQKTYSDHFPVTIDLSSARDHDPAATFAPVIPAHELRAGGWAAATATPAQTEPSAPTAVPAARPDPAAQPGLRAGQFVEVTLVSGRTYTGSLIGSLSGEWLHINRHLGGLIAFPVRNVLSVSEK